LAGGSHGCLTVLKAALILAAAFFPHQPVLKIEHFFAGDLRNPLAAGSKIPTSFYDTIYLWENMMN
jgi:hypothetical protein